MAKITILMASKTEQENYILKRKLEIMESEFVGLDVATIHPMAIPSSVDETTGVVILNFSEWTRREAVHLRDLDDAQFKGQVLVIAKADITAAVKELRERENVVFLEKPYELRDLQGIVRKMLNDHGVQQRIHRRFNTDQDAEVEFYGTKDKFFSRVCNLSKGGAYLEFLSLASVRVGEMVRVKMELKDLNRTYTIPAKIVWTNRSTLSGGTGIGVEFVGRGDVEKLILGY